MQPPARLKALVLNLAIRGKMSDILQEQAIT
jgi:hypothetical protein